MYLLPLGSTMYLPPLGIDPHVHLRGEEYPDDYRALALRDAKAVGLRLLIEQPNCVPQLTSPVVLEQRALMVPRCQRYAGITNNLSEVRKILQLVQQKRYGLVGDKIFYVHSTGDMGVTDHSMQKALWELKAELGYTGISVGHFEDEDEFRIPFDPECPISHSLRRDPMSEYVQVERQLRFATNAGFRGTFYVAHVSNPATVDLVRSLRHYPFHVVLEVTWHHLFLNTDDYQIHGNRVKVNPPLRSPAIQQLLLHQALSAKIDLIGSDHAPHPLARKDDLTTSASGLPALPFYPRGIQLLCEAGMSGMLLDRMLFHRACSLFGWHYPLVRIEPHYQPQLWESYGFNPFSRLG